MASRKSPTSASPKPSHVRSHHARHKNCSAPSPTSPRRSSKVARLRPPPTSTPSRSPSSKQLPGGRRSAAQPRGPPSASGLLRPPRRCVRLPGAPPPKSKPCSRGRWRSHPTTVTPAPKLSPRRSGESPHSEIQRICRSQRRPAGRRNFSSATPPRGFAAEPSHHRSTVTPSAGRPSCSPLASSSQRSVLVLPLPSSSPTATTITAATPKRPHRRPRSNSPRSQPRLQPAPVFHPHHRTHQPRPPPSSRRRRGLRRGSPHQRTRLRRAP